MLFLMMILAVFVVALVAMLIIAALALVGIGSGATALAVGGFAGSRFIKDNHIKKLSAIACLAVFLFALCCFALLGIIFWMEARIILLILGCVLGCAILVLGIIGIVNVRKLSKTRNQVLFSVLFSLLMCFGAIALGTFGILSYLEIMNILPCFCIPALST